MGAAFLLLLVAIPLTGGQLHRLGGLRLRRLWLLPVALGLQVLVINVVPDASVVWLVPVHIATYVLAGVWVWNNRGVPGLTVIACGGGLNGVVIAANNGTLPASAAALRRAGLSAEPGQFTNSGVLAHPHVGWLGDVFAVPAWVPLANVFSVGDVLILLGVGYLLRQVCGAESEVVDGPRPLADMSSVELARELAEARRAADQALMRRRRLQAELAVLRRRRVVSHHRPVRAHR